MAQRLVILNRLGPDKKPMNTIFVKERGHTFPAISYLNYPTRNIIEYCEENSANTMEELFQRACYFAAPALSEKDDEELEYIEKLLGEPYQKSINPDDYYFGAITFTKDVMKTDLDMAEITLIVDWIFTDGKIDLDETKIDLKNAFYNMNREEAIASSMLDEFDINNLREESFELGSVSLRDLQWHYENLPHAWLEKHPDNPDKNIMVLIQ